MELDRGLVILVEVQAGLKEFEVVGQPSDEVCFIVKRCVRRVFQFVFRTWACETGLCGPLRLDGRRVDGGRGKGERGLRIDEWGVVRDES